MAGHPTIYTCDPTGLRRVTDGRATIVPLR